MTNMVGPTDTGKSLAVAMYPMPPNAANSQVDANLRYSASKLLKCCSECEISARSDAANWVSIVSLGFSEPCFSMNRVSMGCSCACDTSVEKPICSQVPISGSTHVSYSKHRE